VDIPGVVVDVATGSGIADAILGVHMVGPHVTDLVAEASTAMFLEGTAGEMGSAVHAHPTLSEIVGEAALAVAGRQINA